MSDLVMHPAFSPKATAASLVTLVISVATVLATLPNGLLNDAHVNGTIIADLQLVATIITGLAGAHLSVSRSLLPSVDGTKTLEVPEPSTVTVDTPAPVKTKSTRKPSTKRKPATKKPTTKK